MTTRVFGSVVLTFAVAASTAVLNTQASAAPSRASRLRGRAASEVRPVGAGAEARRIRATPRHRSGGEMERTIASSVLAESRHGYRPRRNTSQMGISRPTSAPGSSIG